MTKPDPLAEQCTATSKRTGERCRQRVIGGGVCRMHGGATRAAREAKAERIAVGRELMASQAARRRPEDVLLDAMLRADAIASRLMSRMDVDGALPSAGEVRQATESLLVAGRLAKSALGLDKPDDFDVARAAVELQAGVIVAVVRRVLAKFAPRSDASIGAEVAAAFRAVTEGEARAAAAPREVRVDRADVPAGPSNRVGDAKSWWRLAGTLTGAEPELVQLLQVVLALASVEDSVSADVAERSRDVLTGYLAARGPLARDPQVKVGRVLERAEPLALEGR